MEETLKKPQPTPAAEPTAPSKKFQPGAHALKFWLMPFVCFASFGFSTRFGSVISTLSRFVLLCFFILAGYFNVTPERERTSDAYDGFYTVYGIDNSGHYWFYKQ